MKSLLLALMLLTVANSGWTAQYQKQHIKSVKLIAPDWPGLTNADGSGLYWDLIRQIYEPAGVRVVHSEAPWNRALKMVTDYYLYAGIVGVVLDEDERLLTPAYPLETVYLYSLSRKDRAAFELQPDVSAGWFKGYDLFDANQVPFEVKEYRTPQQAVEMLDNGELDYLLDTRDALLDFIRINNRNPDDYQLNRLAEGKGVYIGFYDVQSSKLLIEIYNERVKALRSSGELAKIYQKYGANMPEEGAR